MFLTVLRWLARLSGLAVASGFMLLVLAEFNDHSWRTKALVALICAGMLLAWRWELPCAAVSLAGLVAFMILVHLPLAQFH